MMVGLPDETQRLRRVDSVSLDSEFHPIVFGIAPMVLKNTLLIRKAAVSKPSIKTQIHTKRLRPSKGRATLATAFKWGLSNARPRRWDSAWLSEAVQAGGNLHPEESLE